jgi:hypothetical protein
MSGAISTKALARIIEADLLCERSQRANESAHCLTCGRPHLRVRFCSNRCREGYDAGALAWDESKEKNLSAWTPPLTGWRVVAGVPETLGLNPWQSIIEASEKKRRKIEKRKNRRNKEVSSKGSKGGKIEVGPRPISDFAAHGDVP